MTAGPAHARDDAGPIILFDGVCPLCSRVVRFVIRHDARRLFRFASLQSAPAERLLSRHAWSEPPLSSMILIADGRCYGRSQAALEIAKRLDAPWKLLYVLRVVPRRIADRAYDWLGARRYRWFGKFDACWAPAADVRDRFLG